MTTTIPAPKWDLHVALTRSVMRAAGRLALVDRPLAERVIDAELEHVARRCDCRVCAVAV